MIEKTITEIQDEIYRLNCEFILNRSKGNTDSAVHEKQKELGKKLFVDLRTAVIKECEKMVALGKDKNEVIAFYCKSIRARPPERWFLGEAECNINRMIANRKRGM